MLIASFRYQLSNFSRILSIFLVLWIFSQTTRSGNRQWRSVLRLYSITVQLRCLISLTLRWRMRSTISFLVSYCNILCYRLWLRIYGVTLDSLIRMTLCICRSLSCFYQSHCWNLSYSNMLEMCAIACKFYLKRHFNSKARFYSSLINTFTKSLN